MTDPITIESIEVAGFRAYLESQSFTLQTSKRHASLAVFAPNATGKSSLVDAFEFYFSEVGSLERLGQRASQTQAGPGAMEHVRAESKGISGRVVFKFRQGSYRFEDYRSVKTPGDVPNSAQRVFEAIKVPFVIRGYDLRKFVEASAEIRYGEMATWFALDPLLTIQKNLRLLQRNVKAKYDSDVEMNVRLRELRRATDDKVTEWDEAKVCEWFNSNILNPLNPSLVLSQLLATNPAYVALVEAKKQEHERLGLTALNRLIVDIDEIAGRDAEDALLVEFEASVEKSDNAATRESQERHAASQSIFNEIWNSAAPLFENEDRQLDSCPVCDTRFEDTPHGSHDAVIIGIQTKLKTLAGYRAAENDFKKARIMVTECKRKLIVGLETLSRGMSDAGFEEDEDVSGYSAIVQEWIHGDPVPSSEDLVKALTQMRSSLEEDKTEIERQQGTNTYANSCDKAEQLIRLNGEVNSIVRQKAQLHDLKLDLRNLTQIIEDRINEHVQSMLRDLQDDVNRLYLKMQGSQDPNPSTIRFWLSPDPSKNQQQVRLVVDYAPNRTDVAPTGYLSDSQIHSVAIALRFAALRALNRRAPIVVLDDIVTSYDADHRKNIASTIAEELEGFQVVLVTHDEQFFLLLKDHLPNAHWKFERIVTISQDFGPIFSNYRTVDEVVNTKLSQGESAGEEIRKVEEEWLLKICREFVVDVAIRPVDRPFQYERSELASALGRFLKEKRIVPPKIQGVTNPFVTSLETGIVENFASHFSDNPYRSGSIGDQQTRWDEFRAFRDHFRCPKCDGERFMRPYPIKKPLCQKCETPFKFQDLADLK